MTIKKNIYIKIERYDNHQIKTLIEREKKGYPF